MEDFLSRSVRVWREGRLIERYCRKQNFDPKDIVSLKTFNTLMSNSGVLSGKVTINKLLDYFAAMPEDKRALIIDMTVSYEAKEYCEGLTALSTDRNYALRIQKTYNTEIAPLFRSGSA